VSSFITPSMCYGYTFSMLPNQVAFGTPRKLPRARELRGKVVVLDIAFAGGAGKHSFEQVTLPLISNLGERLVAWVDHHDHEAHVEFKADQRFFLATKAQHGACPEMVTPELVAQLGPVDTILCHTDFDGLASAAKWMRAGIEPYPGCDDDARAVDTRVGKAGPIGERFDRALRARPGDRGLYGIILRHLYGGLSDAALWHEIDAAAAELVPIERETRRAAQAYRHLDPGVAVVDVRAGYGKIDKTMLLLLGQERAPVSIVVDANNLTVAAEFNSGLNFLEMLGLSGGMPTRVSVSHRRLPDLLAALGVPAAEQRVLM
jgi:hypothetical protein